MISQEHSYTNFLLLKLAPLAVHVEYWSVVFDVWRFCRSQWRRELISIKKCPRRELRGRNKQKDLNSKFPKEVISITKLSLSSKLFEISSQEMDNAYGSEEPKIGRHWWLLWCKEKSHMRQMTPWTTNYPEVYFL